jgi:hypothetical protein
LGKGDCQQTRTLKLFSCRLSSLLFTHLNKILQKKTGKLLGKQHFKNV